MPKLFQTGFNFKLFSNVFSDFSEYHLDSIKFSQGENQMGKAKQYVIIGVVAIAALALLKRFAPAVADKVGV